MRQTVTRAAIIMTLGIATLSYGALEKHVEVRVEGIPVFVRTFAGTVGGALARARIAVAPGDRVSPPEAARLRDGARIEVRRAKPVTLLLDGKPRRVVVTGLTIEEVIEEIDLRGSLADAVHPSRGSRVIPGMVISYRHALAVTVVHDDARERVITNARSVGTVVRELGIRLGKRDRIVPRASAAPAPGMEIRVLRVGVKQEVRTLRIPYRTILRRDRHLEYGRRKLVQEGRLGLRRVRYVSKYVDGLRVSRRLLAAKLVRAPLDRIIAIGGGFPGCVCDRGIQYGKATWYHAEGLTAAHRTLPFGTVVRVENLANGRWVNVVIRDRGPWGDGRIIDLSDDAFRRIASLDTGVIRVRIRW